MDEFDDEGDELMLSVTLPQTGQSDGQCTASCPALLNTINIGDSSSVNKCVTLPQTGQSDGQCTTSRPALLNTINIGDSSSVNKSKASTVNADVKQLKDSTKDVAVALPECFPFPFEPYDIQVGFMKELYRCLELGKVGIFESPTGTGKSLSLICGALKWLKDLQQKQREELEVLLQEQELDNEASRHLQIGDNGQSDWISDFARKQEKEEKLNKVKEEQEQMIKREAKMKELRGSVSRHKTKRKRVDLDDEFDSLMEGAARDVKEAYDAEVKELCEQDGGKQTSDAADDHLVVDEYHSDNEDSNTHSGDEDVLDEEHVTKIYYCSRTHSQLSQFVREVMKSPFGDQTRVTSLGSRQNLCVNESVRSLKSLSLMNDRCMELQKNKGKQQKSDDGRTKKKTKGAGCPFYKFELIQDYKDRVLLEVQDIEQLVTLGRQMKACPYFGTRYSVPAAELVALPYNTLLHKATREACGIRIKDNIVIIDEAHNLLETINSVYSIEVSGAQLVRAHSQLRQYEERFRSRLKAKNLMYVRQILFVLSSIIKCLGGNTDVPADKQLIGKPGTKLLTVNNFLFAAQLDNMNLFKVMRYCQKSSISRKLHSFVEKYAIEEIAPAVEKEENSRSGVSKFLHEIQQNKEKTFNKENTVTAVSGKHSAETSATFSSPLMHIEGYLAALTNADKDGRIVVTRQALLSQSTLKFLLLNPAVHFASVLQDARAVIVAGGTMQPLSEFKEQLFYAAGVRPERILEYSCGHVIASNHLLPMSLCSGPSGVQLDFTFQSRDNPVLLDELGRLVANINNLVPGGVVCFFPSYDYEKKVYTHWEKTGFLNRLSAKKRLFREPKKTTQLDQVLTEYSDCIRKCKSLPGSTLTGAMLLSVVGGKMSEGINFSDDLGRCVIMVGLPYPNITSPELKEKMDYLNANFSRDGADRLPGQIHYENLCMKAVNQSIGRAIRHKDDYATILLLDRRYGRANVVSKLPKWIGDHLVKIDKFGPAMAKIAKFFAEKKEKQ